MVALNTNNRYRIEDTLIEPPGKTRPNQQESELITYLTKQYSCSEMFGELII